MKFVNFVDELTQLQPFLYRFAYSLTKNGEAAKDLLQETVLKTLENKEKFIEETNLRAWMCTVMKNTFINDYRKYFLNNESVCRIDDLKSEPFMTGEADMNYDLEWINKMIAGMGEKNRIIFGLYLSSYQYDEIAEKLNIPLGTVKSQIHSIKISLKKQLKELI